MDRLFVLKDCTGRDIVGAPEKIAEEVGSVASRVAGGNHDVTGELALNLQIYIWTMGSTFSPSSGAADRFQPVPKSGSLLRRERAR